MTLRSLLYDRHGHPKLVGPGLVALVLAFGIAWLALGLVHRGQSEDERAHELIEQGDYPAAEAIYAERVKREPTVPHVVELITVHQILAPPKRSHHETDGGLESMFPDAMPSWGGMMPEAELAALIAGLPPDIARVARYLRHDPEAETEITLGADMEPPLPWANHMLALRASFAGGERDELEAARRYFKEGVTFDRSEDVDRAIALYMEAGAWDAVREKTDDPRVMRALTPLHRYEVAVHGGDVRGAFGSFLPMWFGRFHGDALWLSAVAALAWGFFCARLGRVRDRPYFRLPIYFVAFGLGVLSVLPTIALVTIEDAKLGLVESGDLVRDAIVYVFGVGLREEASKLLLFVPLYPILRRYGDKLDVLACGALVGLGFAAEENVGYLAGDMAGGVPRFLTANFFHMALTGTLASAFDDFMRDPDGDASRDRGEFMKTSLLIVVMHGAYDLLIVHPEVGGGFASMLVFVILTKKFVDAIDVARRKAERGLTPVHAFIVALAVVTGASGAYSVRSLGVFVGALQMAGGLVGEVIMIVVFVRLFSFL